MPRLLFICTAYPPAPEVGSLRNAKLSAGLLAHGWDIEILTVGERSYTHPRDQAGALSPPSPHPVLERVPVHRLDAFNPIAAGARLRMPRVSSSAPAPGATVPSRRSWRGPVAEMLTRSLVPDEYAFWARVAARFARSLSPRPEVVLASFPAAGALWAGARVASILRVPLVLDYRDPWEVYGAARTAGPLRTKVETHIRRRLLAEASGVCAVSQDVLERNVSAFNGSTKTGAIVPHGWDPVEAVSVRETPLQSADGVTRVLHAGTVYPNTSDPLPFLTALAGLRAEGRVTSGSFKLIFLGRVQGRVHEFAAGLGLTDMVEVLPEVPRSAALKLMASADALLVLRHSTDKFFVSGKVWDYITAGRPVLAVVNPLAPVADIIRTTGIGRVARHNDVSGIGAALISLLSEPFSPDEEALGALTVEAASAGLDAVLRGLLD